MVGRRRRNFSHSLRVSRLGRVFFEKGRWESRGRPGRAISRNLICNISPREESRDVKARSVAPTYFIIPRSSRRRLVTIPLPPSEVRHTFTRVLSAGTINFPFYAGRASIFPLWLFYGSRDNASAMIGKQCHRASHF